MKLLSSRKADAGTFIVFRNIAMAVLLIAVFVFIVLPLITGPLRVDKCVQMNGVRATTCNSDVAMRNNFIKVDKTNKICCMAQLTKQKEFDLWAKSIENGNGEGPRQTSVAIDDAANMYTTPQGSAGLYFRLGTDSGVATPMIVADSKIIIYPQAGTAKVVDPDAIFNLVGVNNLADGSCTLIVTPAALRIDDNTYHPDQEQGAVLKKENAKCAQGSGVQVTMRLSGLPSENPYYFVSYIVQTQIGTARAFALLNIKQKTTSTTSTSTTTASENSNCARCEDSSTETSCDANKRKNNCNGCYWLKSNSCRDCFNSGSCANYETKASCEANSCSYASSGSLCAWSGKECFDCASITTCADYTRKDSCNANACSALEETNLPKNCVWKSPLFKQSHCEEKA